MCQVIYREEMGENFLGSSLDVGIISQPKKKGKTNLANVHITAFIQNKHTK
jgi:hypothetical protein